MAEQRKIRAKVDHSPEESQIRYKKALKEFLDYQNANAVSKYTYMTYRSCLTIYSYWIEEHFNGEDIPISTLADESLISEYVMWLRSARQVGENTIASYKRNMRVFLYWCMDKKYLIEFRIVIKQPQEEMPETYSDSEIEKLLRKPQTNEFVEYRDWVIVNLMLHTGNRRSTVVGYKIKDIDFDDDNLIMNRTKNKKAQRLPIPPAIHPIIKKYIQVMRADCDGEQPLFPNQFGKWLDPNSLTHSLDKYNKARGVTTTGVHAYRHTFAKRWIREGGSELYLQKALGHSTLAMTEKYVRLFGEDLRPAFNAYNPYAKSMPRGETLNTRMKERKRGRH
jgi:integrase/recombinase XerD